MNAELDTELETRVREMCSQLLRMADVTPGERVVLRLELVRASGTVVGMTDAYITASPA